MTREQVMEMATPIINDIATRYKGSSFAYFTPDDMFQEVWRICLEVLPKYDPDRNKLENFLRTCVSNRLINLKRDRYFRVEKGFDSSGSHCVNDRIGIVNAIPIDTCDPSAVARMLSASSQTSSPSDPSSSLMSKDMITYIVRNLMGRQLDNFLSLIGGVRLSKEDTDSIRNAVEDILREYDE